MKNDKRRNSEHLVRTGIDLIVNEFIKHAYNETRLQETDDLIDEQIDLAAVELKKTLETVYLDMYGRLNNGEFRPEGLSEGDAFWTDLLRSKRR